MGVSNASFRVGELTAAGLPDASVEAVLCTDAIQFPDEPAGAYDEIRRVLKPGGRVVLTCWEPLDRNDERLSVRYAAQTSVSASIRRASRTLRSATARRGWHASTRCGKRPSRFPLATTLRCAPFMRRA
jgi:ubiquinone/menaquinone biosynthesis C-methylase UbiE